VEAICEANILRDVKFPTADSGNKKIEVWVEQVIRNWKELCGPQWHDEELEVGGQHAIGKNVLDVCAVCEQDKIVGDSNCLI
jgi:hypothetical protein